MPTRKKGVSGSGEARKCVLHPLLEVQDSLTHTSTEGSEGRVRKNCSVSEQPHGLAGALQGGEGWV